MATKMNEKIESKLTIVAWVHSHNGRNVNECRFSDNDIHTQYAWSNIYPEIIGLVIHIGDDKSVMSYDFHALTSQGYKNVKECHELNSNCHCWWLFRDKGRKSNTMSCLEYVKFTEDSMEVLEIEVDKAKEMQPDVKKPKIINVTFKKF